MKYLKLIDKFLFALGEDLVSFRNKIAIVCLLLTYLAVKEGGQWSTVMMATLTAIVLKSYFESRDKSTTQTSNNGTHKSEYDGWTKEHGLVATSEKVMKGARKLKKFMKKVRLF